MNKQPKRQANETSLVLKIGFASMAGFALFSLWMYAQGGKVGIMPFIVAGVAFYMIWRVSRYR